MLWNEGKCTIRYTTSVESCASSPPMALTAGPRQWWSLKDSTESFESHCRSLLSSFVPSWLIHLTVSLLQQLSSSKKTRVPASCTRVRVESPRSPKLVCPWLFCWSIITVYAYVMIYCLITAFRALVKAQTQHANFLTKLGFVAKQNKDNWRFISQLIETRKYAHLHTP